MAIWDSLRQDPMSAMILMQGLNSLAGSMSKQNLPPRGAYTPAGYGQQGGGMEEMLPQMLRMQQMQAQQANMAADNELQRKQFEYAQQTAAEQRERRRAAALKLGVDPDLFEEAAAKYAENDAERFGMTTLSPGETAIAGGKEVARNAPLLQATYGGVFNPDPNSGGAFQANPAMQQFDLAKAAAGAARNLTTVNAYERSYEAKRGEQAATRWQQIQDGGVAAEKRFAQLDALHNLIGDLPSGRLAEGARLQIQKGLAGIGVEMNMDEIGTREAAEKFANTMGVQMLNDPSNGLTGPSSDRDVSIYMELQPGLNMTKQGRQLLLDLAAAERKFATRKAEGLRQLEERKGSLLTPTEQASYEATYDKQNSKYEEVYGKWKGKVGAPTPPPADGNVGGAEPPPVPGGGAGLTVSPEAMSLKNQLLGR